MMKFIFTILILVATSCADWAQTILVVNKKDGTADSLLLSQVKSITIQGASIPIPPDMTQVVGGTFLMGSSNSIDVGASPTHLVNLSSFVIDKTEVTYEKWTEVRNWGLTHGYTDLAAGRNGYQGSTKHPVTEVSWNDILKWCNARSEKEGLDPVYYTTNALTTVYRAGGLNPNADAVQWKANGYRLPTEAEWEFAARGGTKAHLYAYSGSDAAGAVSWYNSNSGNNTHSVSTKAANELGLYDMSGNVWEWCWDRYGSYLSSTQKDPKGPATGSYRVLRGGGFNSSDYYGRVAFRVANGPASTEFNYGFRCVRD